MTAIFFGGLHHHERSYILFEYLLSILSAVAAAAYVLIWQHPSMALGINQFLSARTDASP